ncbi:4'-phosphopantetheinyl transferase superfamily protein [Cyanobium sp. NIES-981]|uniref:4'-phosphopantetheinyl transferase family protein n=1 Tax=Cyanobium sp. NIES-981 TaxID=1851505 RepID=UPI0007DDD16B|nr:4'-phosphopantetheinyl transferase superfamily protein [Cyanobium sp. NIES-981]SBO43746.1 Phosphopantetheinyltransferase family protein [Cyanobium sp. NIES-981]
MRAALPGLLRLLAPRELARYGAFRREDDRERFLLGRSALRQLLGCWLQSDPRRLPLAAGAHGKPELRLEGRPAGPPFNVAHSGHLVVLAFHADRGVGVDVERSRPQLAWRPIARRVLPSATVAWLDQRPEAERPEAFLQQWCLLEASLKARGTGLAARGAGVLDARPEPRRWCLAMPPGYRGAVSLLGWG